MEQIKIKEKALKVVARKPFVINSLDVAKDKEREMAVFTSAKKLSEYVFVVTEKSPKKYRWSIVSKLQSASIDVIDNLYQANFEQQEQRLFYQKRAGVKLRLLDHYAEIAFKMQAISQKQMFNIAKYIVEVRKMLAGWSKSTKN